MKSTDDLLCCSVLRQREPALVAADATVAQPYRPDEGRELAPGVRLVEVSEREAMHGRDIGASSL